MSDKPKQVRAKTAAKKLEIPVQDVLRLIGIPEGTEQTLVVLSEVEAAQASELKAVERAMRSSEPRKHRAAKARTDRRSHRVTLDFSLARDDKAMLQLIQGWVDGKRAKVEFKLEPGWKPEHATKGSEPGTICYALPNGVKVDNVPAADFMEMKNGKIPWRIPTPNPRVGELRKWATELANLSFQAQDCRLCGRSIKTVDGPEMAQIKQLLAGKFVLPYINHPLVGDQRELRFRRLHLLCSVWEEQLVDIQLKLDEATNEEIANELVAVAPKVLEQARRRNPKVTEDEIFETLDIVLVRWEKTEEGE